MTFKIRLVEDGSVINFINDDDGERISDIESALIDTLTLRRSKTFNSAIEDGVILEGQLGEFFLYWDGYMTDLRIKNATVSAIDVFQMLEKSGKFSL